MARSVNNQGLGSEAVSTLQSSVVPQCPMPPRFILAGCLVLSCQAVFAQDLNLSDATKDLERKITVDCLTPPVIRKLGPGKIYTLPGRVAQSSAAQCKSLGGKFVLFDQASPRDARSIWEDAAEQGDDYAQFRMGQIYEMGIAGSPDFDMAAKWYKKAADQGNRQAANNLALLYEKGNGVKQDKIVAAKLHRQALGLADQSPNSGKSSPTQDRATSGSVVPGRPVAPSERDLEIGESAGSQPSIQLIDPSLVVTRGDLGDVPVSDDVKSRPITGRVKARGELASFTINDKTVRVDQFGLFQDSVSIGTEGTTVRIVAIDRDGGRDEVILHFKPGKTEATTRSDVALKPPDGAFAANNYALVIGNNLYRDWGELQTAVNDANAIAELLRRKYGFKVKILRDATFEETLNSLNDLVRTLTDKDNLVIYYAGHGYFDLGRRGYWIPVDAERDRNTRWILNVQVTDLLLKMHARQVLVISDSCYSGALTTADNGAVSTIRDDIPDANRINVAKHLSEQHARIVLTSGAVQPVWDVSFGGHSLFAKALLDVLTVNDTVLPGRNMFDAIEGRVIKTSSEIREREERAGRKSPIASDQTPQYAGIQYAGHQGGDFIFVPVAN